MAERKGGCAGVGSDGGDCRQEGPQDVVLYGFGRIGRLLARLLIEKAGSGNGLRLRAVELRTESQRTLEVAIKSYLDLVESSS